MSGAMPKARPWQSEKMTRQAETIGLDILQLLDRAKEPMAPIAIRKAIRPGSSMVGVTDGLVLNMLRMLNKVGNIQSARRVNRLTLTLDMPRFTITEEGRAVLTQFRRRGRARFN